MQDSLSTYPILRDIINSEIKKKKDRITEYDKLVAIELNAYKEAFEDEYASKNLSLHFEPVLHKGSPSIRAQISNPQNSFVIHILLDSYSVPFLIGHMVANLSGTQEGGEIARNCEQIRVILKKRIESNTVGW